MRSSRAISYISLLETKHRIILVLHSRLWNFLNKVIKNALLILKCNTLSFIKDFFCPHGDLYLDLSFWNAHYILYLNIDMHHFMPLTVVIFIFILLHTQELKNFEVRHNSFPIIFVSVAKMHRHKGTHTCARSH